MPCIREKSPYKPNMENPTLKGLSLQKFLSTIILIIIIGTSLLTAGLATIGTLFALLGLAAPNATLKDAILLLLCICLVLALMLAIIYFPLAHAIKTSKCPTPKGLLLCIPALLISLTPVGLIGTVALIGHYEVIKNSPSYSGITYLKSDSFPNSKDNKLAKALMGGDHDFLKWVDKGANLNALSQQGRNFFWWASIAPYSHSATDGIAYLARNGLKLQDGCLPFIIKNREDEPSLSTFLIMAGADYSKLSLTDIVNPVSIRGFLESGMSPNHKFENGKELLDVVIDSNVTNTQKSPTSGAAWKISEDISLYISHGGDVDKVISTQSGDITISQWAQTFIKNSNPTAPSVTRLKAALEKPLTQ